LVFFIFSEKTAKLSKKSLHLILIFDIIVKPMSNRKAEICKVADTHTCVVVVRLGNLQGVSM